MNEEGRQLSCPLVAFDSPKTAIQWSYCLAFREEKGLLLTCQVAGLLISCPVGSERVGMELTSERWLLGWELCTHSDPHSNLVPFPLSCPLPSPPAPKSNFSLKKSSDTWRLSSKHD